VAEDLVAAIKRFGMTNQLIEHDLDGVELDFGIDLQRGHLRSLSSDPDYYPQIEKDLRAEAARMAPHYEVFYSLEKSIRRQVAEALAATEGDQWWESGRVPARVKEEAEKRQKRERDEGATLRSDDPLDFCTFGELGVVIGENWDVFGGMFRSKAAVSRVMARLNSIRGPIAHCSPLDDDEVVRLRLTVRDWFRLME
jgi:hypothetical protein